MPAVTFVEGLIVENPAGKRVGRVKYVLFHPSEPRAVALMVDRPALLWMIDRKPSYVALSPEMIAAAIEDRVVHLPQAKFPSRPAIESELGYSLDQAVIWRGMPVRVANAAPLGVVNDAVFSRKTARVLKVILSEGAVADTAVGRTTVPGEMIVGFDGQAVELKKEYLELPPSGGVAAVSGKGVAYAKVGAEKVADSILAAGVVGMDAVGKSFRSGWGRKAMKAVKDVRKRVDKTIDAQ